MTRQQRRAHTTGTLCILSTADAEQLDPAGGAYVTICDDHGNICNHRTLALARRFLSHPEEYCWNCQEAIHGPKREVGGEMFQ